MPWTVVYTYGKQEEFAVAQLRDQEFDAVCPKYQYYSRTKSKELLERPLFPCYIFLQIERDRRWAAVNSTRGVIRLLTSHVSNPRSNRDRIDPLPLWLPKGVVENWMENPLSEAPLTLPPGTRVRVRDKKNPLYRMEGVVQKMGVRDRVHVLFHLFSQEVQVEFVSQDELERTDGG